MRYFWLLFVLWPFAEIFTFFSVAEEIGLLRAFLLCVLTAVIGLFLIQKQGFETFVRAQSLMREGTMPVKEVFQGLCLSAAGLLFILPGFLTDILAILLLLPAARERIRLFVTRRTSKTEPDLGVIDGTFERIDE